MRKVKRGQKLPGFYPPNAETKARYEAEKKSQPAYLASWGRARNSCDYAHSRLLFR
jgi:hypothetical protein